MSHRATATEPPAGDSGRGFDVKRSLAIVCAALVVWAYLVKAFWPFIVDDAFITFRYSQHVAAGLGPVYSVGQRAEGYTSLMWMLLLTIPHLFQRDPVVWSKCAGVACAWVVSGLVFRFSVRAAEPSDSRVAKLKNSRTAMPSASLAVALFITSPMTAIHAVSGMETMLFAGLLTWFFAQTAAFA